MIRTIAPVSRFFEGSAGESGALERARDERKGRDGCLEVLHVANVVTIARNNGCSLEVTVGNGSWRFVLDSRPAFTQIRGHISDDEFSRMQIGFRSGRVSFGVGRL